MVKITNENPNAPTTPAAINLIMTVTKVCDNPKLSSKFPNQFPIKVIGSPKKFIEHSLNNFSNIYLAIYI